MFYYAILSIPIPQTQLNRTSQAKLIDDKTVLPNKLVAYPRQGVELCASHGTPPQKALKISQSGVICHQVACPPGEAGCHARLLKDPAYIIYPSYPSRQSTNEIPSLAPFFPPTPFLKKPA